jgi:two-component system, OmpR family, response regulator ChvI
MGSPRKQSKVLMADDEPDINMSFKLTLEGAGFIVDVYNDPLIALSKFKPSYYDLVILDIKMPKMNGFELYTEIQKIDNQVKVCFITAGEIYYNEVRKGKGKEEEEYCKLDEERFLQKPISNVDLVNRINKIMMQTKRPEILQNK